MERFNTTDGWYDGRPVVSGSTPQNRSSARSSPPTKTSITRTGLSSQIQSSRHSGKRVLCPRSIPSTKRFIRFLRKSRRNHTARITSTRVFTHGVIGAGAFRPRCMPPSLALGLIPRRTIVDQYVALDVSLQKTAVCVLNVSGRVLIEADVPSEPAALIAFIQTHAPRAARGGLESGPTSPWLWPSLRAAGVPVVCMDAAALSVRPSKSDRNDAHGL